MSTELNKEALLALFQEALPDLIKSTFGVSVEELTTQFQTNAATASSASTAYLGSLLGLKGKELLEARDKISDYYAKLPESDRAKYQDDSAVLDLWQSISSESPTSPDIVGGSTEASKVDSEGRPLYTFEEAQRILADPTATEEDLALVQEAYSVGNVAEPVYS